jgi:hypothetical protein
MKSKGGSLYEVLKSASRPAGADDGAAPAAEPSAPAAAEGGAQPTLQERLAAYKAAKLAAATQSTAVVAPDPAPAKPAPATVVLEPDPTPVPAPARVQPLVVAAPAAESEATPLPAASKGPGERVVKLTYNTALFSAMIVVGLLFIAYAVGLHVGKTQGAADAVAPVRPVAPAPVVAPTPAPVAAPPAAPAKQYTIRLGEWRYVTSQDRVKALALADDPELKRALERAGRRSFEKARIVRGTEERLALYVDRFSDINSDAARAALTAMKTFKFKNQTPFSQATFEELPQSR